MAMSFEKLLDEGKEAEDKFELFLIFNNKWYQKLGQENWLPKWIHGVLRPINDRLEIKIIRHVPDFATNKCMVQVKHAPHSNEYPTVTIQQDCYEVASYFTDLGIPVLITYMMSDGLFHANWTENIHTHPANTPREFTNGSHTPYFIIPKSDFLPIYEFIDQI